MYLVFIERNLKEITMIGQFLKEIILINPVKSIKFVNQSTTYILIQ